MKRKLYPYQEKMVEYLQHNEHPALFAEMRLGKTLCTIRALKGFMKWGRKLIITPKSVISVWVDELEAEGLTSYTHFTSNTLNYLKHVAGIDWILPEWIVMNYEAAMRIDPKFLEENIDVLVLDESVCIKDPRTNRAKFFLQNFRNVKKRVVLTGNPAPNTPLEYYNQFKFLDGDWLNCENYYQFRARFFASDLMGYQFWARSSSKEVLKREINERAFILTRQQAGVANVKAYQKRMVDLPANVKRLYDDMLEEFFVNLPSGSKLETNYVVAQLAYLQQLASGHIKREEVSDFKVRELVSLIQGELKGQQIVVWSYFTWEIQQIVKTLKKYGVSCAFIDGSVPVEKRKSLRDSFQSGKLNCLIMQVSTGKYGLNLSAASTAIYFSNSLKPDDRNQSEYRIEHNEKTEPLLYIDLCSRGTVDESILKALKNKRKNSYYFLEDVVENLREQREAA